MDVTCPFCEQQFDVWNHEDWEECGWDMACPHCGENVNICVETEYSYTARNFN